MMENTSGDPVLEIDDQQNSSEETKLLPNAHSAGLVMGFIFLCVFSYCIYRIIKRKWCPRRDFSSSEDKKARDVEETEDGIMKQREAYLAIYGPKKNISSISGAISKNERTEITLSSPRQY